MKPRVVIVQGVLGALLLACGDSTPPPANPTPPPASAAASTEAAQMTPPASASAATPPPPAEPTAEEKKKAEDKKALDDDRAKWDTAHKKELDRWTPDMHAQAKALTEKAYPNGHAAIAAMVASKTRAPGNADRDKYRHPIETLDFFGFQPGMTVIDIGPGEGWYTELLAPALAKKGHYLATGGDPNGPADARPTFYAQRFNQFLSTSPELYGKTEMIVVDGKAPHLPQEGTVDMVLIMRGVHGMVNGGTFDTWLKEITKALKPGGVLGIEEHRAKPGADAKETAKKGYVPEQTIIDAATAAGLKLDKKSDINANAKDTKDYPDGVWNLPPTFRAGDKDKDKYAAIGESDRMTLKFVKPKAAAAPPAPKK
jgi:predicted methyltransferase